MNLTSNYIIRNILLASLLILISDNMFAQKHYANDVKIKTAEEETPKDCEAIKYSFSSEQDSTPILLEKFIYKTSSREYTTYLRDTVLNNWNPYTKSEWRRDKKGNDTLYLYSIWDNNSSTFIGKRQIEYVLYSDKLEATQYIKYNNFWQEEKKYVYEYATGNQGGIILESYSEYIWTWEAGQIDDSPIRTITQKFDSLERIEERIESLYNDNNEVLKYKKNEYIYESPSQYIVNNYFWSFHEEWDISEKINHNINLNNDTTIVLSVWKNSALHLDSKEEKIYDENDRLILDIIYKWEASWEENSRTEKNYNDEGNIISIMKYERNEELDEMQIKTKKYYDYSGSQTTAANINLSNDITFYPVPAEEILFIKGINKSVTVTAKIYAIQGTLLKQEIITNNKINTSDLPHGMYLIQLFENNNLLLTKKIIKK